MIQSLLTWVTGSIGGPLGWLAGILLNFLWGKAETAIQTVEKDQADHQKAVDQAAQDNEAASKINEGSSSSEVDQAIEDSLKHV